MTIPYVTYIYKPEIQTKPKKLLQLPAKKLQQNENPPINLSTRKPHETLLSQRNHSNCQPRNFNKMKILSQTEVQEKPTKTLLTNSKKMKFPSLLHPNPQIARKSKKTRFQEKPTKTFLLNSKKIQENWVSWHTLTVILWESGKGWPSLGLTIVYFPTVMALVLMSSDMHLVWPDWRSNRSDWTVFDINPRVKRRDTSVNLWIAMGFEERERELERELLDYGLAPMAEGI